MALKIRLARGGAKRRPFYSIVVADSRSPRDGRFIEKIGTNNPMVPRDHAERVTLNTERARYWLDQGALPTERVYRFFVKEGLVPERPVPNNPKKSAPKAKAQERLREAEEAARAKAEAEAEAKAAPAEEAPAEEPAAEEPAADEPAAEDSAAEDSAAENSAAEASEEAEKA